MTRYTKFIAVFLFLLSTSGLASSQLKIIAVIDTAYAHGGKVEFPLSSFGDDVTDFYGVFPDIHDSSKLTICGKVGTADPTKKKIGLVRLNPNGTFDSSFAVGGKQIISWSNSDYPNSLYVTADNNSDIFLAGMSSGASGEVDSVPALFKFKRNGLPDQSFGVTGHVAMRYDSATSGEFVTVMPEDTTLLACGRVTKHAQNGYNGFCAMRFHADGSLDTTFGIKGKALLPATVHTVSAYLTKNASITFIGARDTIGLSFLILARMTPKGLPDVTFGINGIQNTNVAFNGKLGRLVTSIQPDYKIVAALPPLGIAGLMPITLVRFTSEGQTDTTYGSHGFVSIAFTDGESKARGINIAKNGKTVISGSSVGSLESCATSRSNLDGSPDITFNQIGKAIIDVDSGKYSNNLIRFVGIGLKRYIGIGTSIHDGKPQFLVARFKDDSLQNVVNTSTGISESISLMPNPCHELLTLSNSKGTIHGIRISDNLGREYFQDLNLRAEPSLQIDVSKFQSGIYTCAIALESNVVIKKFVVIR